MASMQRSSGEIRPLTGIRGVAALWVVSCHWAGPELTGIGRDIALHGYAAVDLFMILSGFVIGLSHGAHVGPSVWSGYGRFLVRRFIRLYPLYLAATLVCLILVLARGETWVTPGVVASNLLMLDTTLWDVDAIDGPSWAVSVEWTLNLFFPVFCYLCLRLSRRWMLAMAALAAASLVLTSVLEVHWNNGIPGSLGVLDNRLLYLRCAPEFTLGLLIWRWWEEAGRRTRFGASGWVVACLLTMAATLPFKSMDYPFVIAFCLLLPGLAEARSPVARIFAIEPVRWVGTVSYSLYLWHAAFIPLRDFIVSLLPGLGVRLAGMAANSLTLAVVLLVSGLSYRWIERPAQRWLRGAAQSAEPGRFAQPRR